MARVDYGKITLAILREFASGERSYLDGPKGSPCPLPGLTGEEAAELGRLRDEARSPATKRRD